MISIVLPIYNEKDNLADLICEIDTAMGRVLCDFEVIAVNDGSDDGSAEILTELEKIYGFLRRIDLEVRSGQSRAVFAGFREARGNIVVTMDADLQNDPADIHEMLRHLEEGVHMVSGVRRDRNDPFVKLISSRVANWIRRKTLKSEIIDSACGFRILRRECLDTIDFFDGVHRFLPDLFLLNGFKVKQVAINHRPRQYGETKYNTRNRLLKPFYGLVKVKMMIKK